MHEWCRCLYCKSQVDLFVGCDVCSSSYPFLLWSACCCKPEILSILWARVHFNADILNSLKLCYGIIRRLLSSMIICNTDLVIIICCHKCNTWLQYKIMIWKNCRVIMTFNVRRQRSWYKTFIALLLPSYSTWSCLIMFLYHPVHSIIQLHMHARCSFFFKIRPLTLLFNSFEKTLLLPIYHFLDILSDLLQNVKVVTVELRFERIIHFCTCTITMQIQ